MNDDIKGIIERLKQSLSTEVAEINAHRSTGDENKQVEIVADMMILIDGLIYLVENALTCDENKG